MRMIFRKTGVHFSGSCFYCPHEALVQRMPLGLTEAIRPVSSEISQARRTSVHHSFSSLPLASPMKFSVSSFPCTQAMENSTSFCGFGTTKGSTTTNDEGVAAVAVDTSRLL